jgi:argininosuccinate lyase
MRRGAAQPELMAAGLAVALARGGMPFRRAHGLVGSLVADAQRNGAGLLETARIALASQPPAVASQIDALLDPMQAVQSKLAAGGTAPEAVRATLHAALSRVR